ncbi:hypothetical protein [Paenarthrobacter sp. PH39-S1]|uniref:hypothetical protein n=1 Tax=Paenarthrobacter sp. PH39-S1 TaxID=3046204 RepID=UPI0024B99297|nr:hypothetical protein [Paenarthrobacter sp. PH39-S1]MDJ0355293.1 hypothetical protein [Paenarthrobacter sp. PH39-S1]
MSMLDQSLCWAVLAQVSAAELQHAIVSEWNQRFPHVRVDPPPWHVVRGGGDYNALVCDSPGNEGTDRPFAETLSLLAAGKKVYTLWFDLDRQSIFEWMNGDEVSYQERDPFDLAASLGFEVRRPAGPRQARTAVVVEGASVADVLAALGETADEPWLHIAQGFIGVVVTADDGLLGSVPWVIAEALPRATVYYLQRRAEPGEFTVLMLRGSEQLGWLQLPTLADSSTLSDIKGATTPDEICAVLGLPPNSLAAG